MLHLRSTGQGDSLSLGQEYGEMLPKTGIYYLPDFRVTGFLRLIEDLTKQESTGFEYYRINMLTIKYKMIANIELKRQIRKMQRRKHLELQKIEQL